MSAGAPAWQAVLDPTLVARLSRPLRRPGLISLATVRRLQAIAEGAFDRFPLLERFAHRIREMSTLDTPIVYARSVSVAERASPPALAGAVDAPNHTHTIERVIARTVLHDHVTRVVTVPARPNVTPPPAATEHHTVSIAVTETRAAIDAPTHPIMQAPHVVSPPAPTPAHDSMPRRSRMGAQIVKRVAQAVAVTPALVARVAAPLHAAPLHVAPDQETPGKTPPAVVAAPARRPTASSASAIATPEAMHVSSRVIVAPRPRAADVARVPVVHAHSDARPAATPAATPIVVRAGRDVPVHPALPERAPAVVASAPPAEIPSSMTVASPAAHAPTAAAPHAASAHVTEAHAAPAVPPRRMQPLPTPAVDVHAVADHVERILSRRALRERERKGLRR